jgi:hydroxyacylglutathione hydrolase
MSSGVEIERLINYPVESNCYVITSNKDEKCIIVDPAQEEGKTLCEYLRIKGLKPDLILLTHEHFDHISSVETLREQFKCKVVSSAKCSENITNSKKNLSLFYDQKGFICSRSDVIIETDEDFLEWQDLRIKFYLTPGHSEGGMCFEIDGNLFTGDSLMEEYRTTVKLPGGNQRKLIESVQNLLKRFDMSTKIFPGHGKMFNLEKFASKTSLWQM